MKEFDKGLLNFHYKKNLLKWGCTFLLILCFSVQIFANALTSGISRPDFTIDSLTKKIQNADTLYSSEVREAILQKLNKTLDFLIKAEQSIEQTNKFQSIMDNFLIYEKEIKDKSDEFRNNPPERLQATTPSEYEIAIQRIGNYIEELNNQIQKENEEMRDSNNFHTAELVQSKRLRIDEIDKTLATDEATRQDEYAKNMLIAEKFALVVSIRENELRQISSSNRQELARLRLELTFLRLEYAEDQQQSLRNELANLRNQEASLAVSATEELQNIESNLPENIQRIFQDNRQIPAEIKRITSRTQEVVELQRQRQREIQQVQNTLDSIREQSQWISVSPALGKSLRLQVSNLPISPNKRRHDEEMAALSIGRISNQETLNQVNASRDLLIREYENQLDDKVKNLVTDQFTTRRDLLRTLITSHDELIKELTSLIILESQLSQTLIETQEVTNRYLFWVADVDPISLSFPFSLAADLFSFIQQDYLKIIKDGFYATIAQTINLTFFLVALIFMSVILLMRRRYFTFLEETSKKVGKVTQDGFLLTIKVFVFSIVFSSPIPLIIQFLSNLLQVSTQPDIIFALGLGLMYGAPMLWVFMVLKTFSHPNGLFISHFRWPSAVVRKSLSIYKYLFLVVIPLVVISSLFNNYADRKFADSLGRTFFIVLCLFVTWITFRLKRGGVNFYVNKEAGNQRIINKLLWFIILVAPIVAAVASGYGYLATSIALLLRLETSILCIFGLRLIYSFIHRWMLIQKRKIEFERAKQRRAERLLERAKMEALDESSASNTSNNEGNLEIEIAPIDLDSISAKSLSLVSSLLTMTGIVIVILLWSELHSAFDFLNNITLWQTNSTVNGEDVSQAITIGSILISLLIFFITAQLVRNLPALLELALLQHLVLTPGTGFTITTITKYLTMLIGGMIGFSWMGIEWSKLQWLVAALGVGLGFGLQEIFANFISGLILLFEKPMRIGDVVTLRELTGTVARIRTRATEIIDFDNKEIIVPNKAFITEQFINWSLTDAITRVVMVIPVPQEVDTDYATQLILKAANECYMVVQEPTPPEAFVFSMDNGIQQFNLRVHTDNIRFLFPMRHDIHQRILKLFREAGIKLAHPPLHVKTEAIHP
ncbi:miniconductance mechanosensitive channel MscM [Thorsellia kenyensis]|uniref:Miniconductance mechanosensitive channel MscM n=1 Tax=Thorsellia kenyensis TaxID=1549888 RepID=A0ABV6CBN1_9GAMM